MRIEHLKGKLLDCAIAQFLRYRAYLSERSGRTYIYLVRPGEPDPWKRMPDSDPSRFKRVLLTEVPDDIFPATSGILPFSTEWAVGGPLIDQFDVELGNVWLHVDGVKHAEKRRTAAIWKDGRVPNVQVGKASLDAAMRGILAHFYGDEMPVEDITS